MDQRSSVSYGTWLPTGGTGKRDSRGAKGPKLRPYNRNRECKKVSGRPSVGIASSH
jgi:hypothetical protein